MLKKSVNKNDKKILKKNPAQRPQALKTNASGARAPVSQNQKNTQKITPKNTQKNIQKNTPKNTVKNTPENSVKTNPKNTKKPSGKLFNKNNKKPAQKKFKKTQQNIPAQQAKTPAKNGAQAPERQPAAPYNKKADKELSRVMNEKAPVKKKRSFRGGNYILYYALAIIVIVIVLAILSNTVLFRCSEIEVTGNVRYTYEQIISGSELKTGDNLLHIDANAAAKKIVDRCLFVDEAEVKKSFPTKIIITVKEAEVSFCVSENGKNAAVSRAGRVIKFLDDPSEAIILTGFEPQSIELGVWLSSKNETKNELPWEMLRLMEEAKLTNITEIDISDRYSPKVLIDNRILLNLGSATQLESKFLVAKALIDTEVADNESVIISLSNPEQPAIRPNNSSGSGAVLPPDIENSAESSSSD